MLCTLKRAAVAGFSSTFSFATRTRPAISAASSSIAGAIIRHGPHQGAHRSSNTGSGERSTSAANVASVTVTGLSEMGRGVLHCPQTGFSRCSIFFCGTRLVTPQAGQRINSVSVIALNNFRRLSFMQRHVSALTVRRKDSEEMSFCDSCLTLLPCRAEPLFPHCLQQLLKRGLCQHAVEL